VISTHDDPAENFRTMRTGIALIVLIGLVRLAALYFTGV